MAHYEAYLAGMVDSDGSITLGKKTKATTTRGYQYRIQVQIGQKYNVKVEEYFKGLVDRYGGSVWQNHRITNISELDHIKYSCSGPSALKLIKAIRPYLILKTEMADLAIRLQESTIYGRYGNGRLKPESVWDFQDNLYDQALIVREK